MSEIIEPVECDECNGSLDAHELDCPIALRAAVKGKITHEGDFELLDAKWELKGGRTVEFRIIEAPGDDVVHPFKKYQKRRAGRVGTIFHCVMTHRETAEIVLDTNVQLAAWAEGSDKGQSVKFWVDEDSSLHPFAGYRGKSGNVVGDIFVGILVEIADDGTAIDQKARELAERGSRRYTLSQYAWQLAHMNGRFLQFLEEKIPKPPKYPDLDWTPDVAHQFIKSRCKIESLGDLDRFPEAAEIFHQNIRRPYAKWSGEL